MEEEELKIYSEEVRDVLSKPPKSIYRWGNTILLCFILLLLAFSWFIKYPDAIGGSVVLTTEQPPSRLVSQTDGYIEELLKPNESIVLKGDEIAEIRSPIRKSSIDSLFSMLNAEETVLITELKALKDLGNLQEEVNVLISNLSEYRDIIEGGFFKKSLKNVSDQIAYNNRLAQITKQELELLKVEIANAKEKLEADSLLYAKKVIAKHTFYSNQSEYFSKKQQLINVKKAYVQYQITSSNYEKQEIDLRKNAEDQKRQLETAISASKKSIESAISNWQQNFILTAPIEGKLSYLSNLAEQQYVKVQQTLFAIIPEQKAIIGIVEISNQAFGKVRVGQKVRMRFDNNPYQEFGQLRGEVIEVSRIPSEKGYFLKVALENGLTTTFKKEIEYKPEMTGTAEVITEDLRLIERVFNNLRKILDK